MSLDVSTHGGGCCGIIHLSDFNDYDGVLSDEEGKTAFIKEGVDDAIQQYSENFVSCNCGHCPSSKHNKDNWHCACEVVLNEHQMKSWRNAVETVGFRQSFSFLNSNSGNRCHVFYLETNV